MSQSEDFTLVTPRGVLLIGERTDPELARWQVALQQERLTAPVRIFLQQAACDEILRWRILNSPVGVMPGLIRHDVTFARRIADAIEAGGLAAVYLPTRFSASAVTTYPMELPFRSARLEAPELPLWQWDGVRRVVEMLKRAMEPPSPAHAHLRAMLADRDLNPLAAILLAVVNPIEGNERVFLDAGLAGWAYDRAGRQGLTALFGLVCAVRAALEAGTLDQLEVAAQRFLQEIGRLGTGLFPILLSRRTMRGDTDGGDDFDMPLRSSTPRLRQRTAADLEAPDTFPDSGRQATALRRASRHGKPFCAICGS